MADDQPDGNDERLDQRGLPEPLAKSMSQAAGELLLRVFGPAAISWIC